MSARAVQWVLKHSPHTDNERLCLIVLAWNARDDAGLSYTPDPVELARECGVSRATLYRLLARLKATGTIDVVPGRGRGNHSRVTLLLPESVSAGETDKSVSSVSTGETYSAESVSTGRDTLPEESVSLEPIKCLTTHARAQYPGPKKESKGSVVPVTVDGQRRVSEVRTILAERELPAVLTGYDKTQIAECEADAETIADAYETLLSDKWGDPYCRGNKSPGTAAKNISTYLSWKQRGGSNPTLKGGEAAQSAMNDVMESLLGRNYRSEAQPGVPRLPGGVSKAVGKTWADEPF